nr:putative ribonuclease H-like domain-containing protein [Tanacetum cinerariifolium]
LPSIDFMRPFGCPITILNTLDHLGKFQGKVSEGFLVGYSVYSSGLAWLFDIDSLTRTMNYHPVITENQTNSHADALVDGKDHDDDIQKSVSLDIHLSSSGTQTRKQGDKTENKDKGKSPVITITGFRNLNAEFEECTNNSSNGVNAASSLVSTAGHNFINSTNDFSAAGPSNTAANDVGAETDINNLESIISVSPIPTTRIQKDHLTSQIIGDLSSTTQTRSMARAVRDQVYQMDVKSAFLYGTIEEEVDVCQPPGFEDPENPDKVYKVVKALYGLHQAPRACAFLYGTIEEEVYVCQPPGFEDPENPDKVYKVVKALYGLHQAPRAWYETLATYLLENGFQRGTIKQTLFIKKQQKDILLVQIYVDNIIFGKSASTPIDAEKPLLKDSDGEDVDVHTYSQENL